RSVRFQSKARKRGKQSGEKYPTLLKLDLSAPNQNFPNCFILLQSRHNFQKQILTIYLVTILYAQGGKISTDEECSVTPHDFPEKWEHIPETENKYEATRHRSQQQIQRVLA
ncbi:unnamed protein product, partial [Ectocarpus sp. 12 AP-2014]